MQKHSDGQTQSCGVMPSLICTGLAAQQLLPKSAGPWSAALWGGKGLMEGRQGGNGGGGVLHAVGSYPTFVCHCQSEAVFLFLLL